MLNTGVSPSIAGITGRFASIGQTTLSSDKAVANGAAAEDVSTASCHLSAVAGEVYLSGQSVCTAISGNYYWRDRELSDRALRHDQRSTLAFAYEKHGDKLLDKLAGRFALAIWDSRNRRGLVATDRFGQMPVYWSRHNDEVFIGPTATSLADRVGAGPRLSIQGLYHYLFFHMVPSPGSIFEDVNKLPAAHALRIADGDVQPFCYWIPAFSERPAGREEAAHAEMLQLLQSSVAQLAGETSTGAFLSGGLDSSTVSGMLARHRPQDAQTFSIGFDAEGYDEMAYARIASEHFSTHAHEYYVTPEDVLEVLPGVAAAYDEPFGNSSAIPAYFCAKLARENGISRLLAGDGGDELFAGNERYAKQTLFEIYQALPAGLRSHLLEPLAAKLPRRGLSGKFASYIEQAKVPLPARLHSYNFLTRFDHHTMFDASFLAQIDTGLPFQLEQAIYHRPAGASRLNRMLYLDWQHTLADNDLRKVNRMCQLAGIEVEYPMLDDLVVEFSTRIPSSKKMRFNRLRDFYKRAVADFLPATIINKSKHGFGLPFGVWMSSHAGLQDLATQNLGRFRERGILNTGFIDDVLQLHNQSHAGYYGELVWILVMLELWLTQHGF